MSKKILFLVLCITFCSFMLSGCSKTKKLMEEANALVEEKEYEEAIELYEEALELDEKDEEIYLSLADAYLKMNDYAKAMDIVEEGLDEIDSDKLESKKKSINRKIKNAKEKDIQLLDNMRQALTTCFLDPQITPSSDFLDCLTEDSTSTLRDITTWDVNYNDFTKEVADIFGLNSYSELKDLLKTPDISGKIIVTYNRNNGRFKVELEGTDIVVE